MDENKFNFTDKRLRELTHDGGTKPAVPAAPVSPVLTRGWAQRFRKLFCNTALFCQGV